MAWFLYCIIYYNFCTVLYAFRKYVRNKKLKKKKKTKLQQKTLCEWLLSANRSVLIYSSLIYSQINFRRLCVYLIHVHVIIWRHTQISERAVRRLSIFTLYNYQRNNWNKTQWFLFSVFIAFSFSYIKC